MKKLTFRAYHVRSVQEFKESLVKISACAYCTVDGFDHSSTKMGLNNDNILSCFYIDRWLFNNIQLYKLTRRVWSINVLETQGHDDQLWTFQSDTTWFCSISTFLRDYWNFTYSTVLVINSKHFDYITVKRPLVNKIYNFTIYNNKTPDL